MYQNMKIENAILNKKRTNIEESIGTKPPLQIYPLIFIINFGTKIVFNMKCFLSLSEPCQISKIMKYLARSKQSTC